VPDAQTDYLTFTVSAGGSTSPPANVTFDVMQVNNLPVFAAPPHLSTPEDSPLSLLPFLDSLSDDDSDLAAGSCLFIASLPAHGDLTFVLESGETVPLAESFNEHLLSVPGVVEQYASTLTDVSSYWGADLPEGSVLCEVSGRAGERASEAAY
jgi:hypothetical protein